MDSKVKADEFLIAHNFSISIADKLHQKIFSDMQTGLKTGGADQAMIKAGSAVIRNIKAGESVIVIDAGGTNFRSCLVTKTNNGLEVSDFEKTSMPAIDHELNKKEFYKAIADNISRLKDSADTISFCFSYAMAITEDGDGKIIRFSKEVKAPEAVGTYLGKELLSELKIQGWKKVKKINVLNDTTALLLSSFVEAGRKNYKSHIAFILGTGMNSAYINKGQIIVTECGMFSDLYQSDFDLRVCSHTTEPGKSLLEKMTSGAYLGELAFEMINSACQENIFSKAFAEEFSKLSFVSTADFDQILLPRQISDSKKIITSHLMPALEKGTSEDSQILKTILESIITRSAFLTAEAIYAAILDTDKNEKDSAAPVAIACNGSTFWKTPLLKEKVESRLKELLPTDFEIIKIDDDITKGSFAAAFIQ